jgi:hypothetical protein
VRHFDERLFNAEFGILSEHLSGRWGDHPGPLKQQVIELGHHFERVWLLQGR